METRDKVRKIVDTHNLVRIATIDNQGLPKVRSVDFVANKEDESILYFMTFKFSNKVKELQNNNNVHIVIDKDANSMEELERVLYIKGSGIAFEVQSQEEIQKGMELILEKFPYLKNMPGDPSMMTMFRVELSKVTVSDNSISFGHVEEYSYR